MRNIADDYLQHRPELAGCFAGYPEDCLRRKPETAAWNPALAAAVNRHQTSLEQDTRPLSGVEPVVVTGQQPGVFTGPLYTIYKAITAVALAERLTENSGIPCRPLFWTASDDHDFEEIRTAHFLTRRYDLHTIAYAPAVETTPGTNAWPAWRIPVQESLHAEIDLLASLCRGSEYTCDITEFLHDSVRQSASLGAWFSRIMARLFQGTGLLLFTPELPEARRAAIPIFRREIETPLHTTALLLEAGGELAALGYDPPIHRDPEACNFFLDVAGQRCKVVYRSGRFHVPQTAIQFHPEEMLGLLEREPERFSPNVALRPMVQQALFPAIAYVAGPGEIAYWAQLRRLFAFFDLPMPLVYPRASALLLTSKTRQLLGQYGLQSEQLNAQGEDLLTRALRQCDDLPALRAFSALHPPLEQSAARLAEGLQHAGAAREAARFEAALQAALQRLEHRLLHADQHRRAKVEAHLARLYNTIMPLGRPQERVLNIFSFLLEHGWPLIGQLRKELDVERFTRQEVEL